MARRGNRSPKQVEAMEYLAAARRFIRGAGRRVADADEPELAALLALRDEVDAAVQVAVDGQRSIGRSWQHIANATGTTRAAAWQRWGGYQRPSRAKITPQDEE